MNQTEWKHLHFKRWIICLMTIYLRLEIRRVIRNSFFVAQLIQWCVLSLHFNQGWWILESRSFIKAFTAVIIGKRTIISILFFKVIQDYINKETIFSCFYCKSQQALIWLHPNTPSSTPGFSDRINYHFTHMWRVFEPKRTWARPIQICKASLKKQLHWYK